MRGKILKNNIKSEKNLLKIIKIAPILSIIIVSIFTTSFLINRSVVQGKEELKQIAETYKQNQKKLVKDEVLRVTKQIRYAKSLSEEKLKENIKESVNTAHTIATNIYNQNRDKDKNSIIKMIKDALRNIRFNQGRGYYFIYSMDLQNILLPLEPQREGEDFSNYQDIKGSYVVKDTARLIKKHKEVFFTWYWIKPNDKSKNYKKIGFTKYFEPFDWFIGTGEYLDDFEQEIKNNLIKKIRTIKFGKNEHIVIHNYDGISLIDNNKSIVGKNSINFKNKKELVKEVIAIAKNGGGYLEYIATYGVKISYISGVDDWGWEVSAGFYLNDIDKKIHKKEIELKSKLNETLMELIILSFFVTSILVLIFFEIAKHAEKQFSLYKNTISEEIKKNESQLVLLQEQNKLASMGEMVGNIAHQWRQPLNTLGISISKMSLLLEDDKLTKEVMVSSFDRMEKTVLYLSKTIDVFRRFFKHDNKSDDFNLGKAIENTLLIIRDSFSNRFIELSFTCKQTILIKGDSKEFQQVLMNLLNNSKDAIVSSKIKDAKVSIKIEKLVDTVKICIKDNGGGISKDIANKIYEPYFSTKFKDQGTGIGLYMSKVILEKHFQGTIRHKNIDGGVEFCIVLLI